jgi:hypothetical protein
MVWSDIFMITGFCLAAYSVVGNDVIQTLGTFLSSNSNQKWYILYAYIGSIMLAVLVYGWLAYDGDVSYGLLNKVKFPSDFQWWIIIPPLVLLTITRFGIPVSTTFLILNVFNSDMIQPMLLKSLIGYVVSFVLAFAVYSFTTKKIELYFIKTEMKKHQVGWWMALQWISTGFLWSQWLKQDLANIYVYLPRRLDAGSFALSVVLFMGLLAFVIYQRGGAVQKVVTTKTNTSDIRSATIIDFLYGGILLFLLELSRIPMSTTWVFVGLLAGRELAMGLQLKSPALSEILKIVRVDFTKILAGLFVSVALVYLIKFLN